MKSILSFLIKFKFLASPLWIYTFPEFSNWKSIFSLHLSIATSFTSTPIIFLLSNFASTSVVPPPINWSKIKSFSFVYLRIKFLGIYGDQFPLHFASWVAQSPLSLKLQTEFNSNSNFQNFSYFPQFIYSLLLIIH